MGWVYPQYSDNLDHGTKCSCHRIQQQISYRIPQGCSMIWPPPGPLFFFHQYLDPASLVPSVLWMVFRRCFSGTNLQPCKIMEKNQQFLQYRSKVQLSQRLQAPTTNPNPARPLPKSSVAEAAPLNQCITCHRVSSIPTTTSWKGGGKDTRHSSQNELRRVTVSHIS